MYKYVFFLGVNSSLCATECLTTLKRERYSPTLVAEDKFFLILSLERKLPDNFIDQLGGITRIAVIKGSGAKPFTSEDLYAALSPTEKKFNVGFGYYYLPQNYISRLAKDFKDECRNNNLRPRYIMPRSRNNVLNAAQVIFNQLTESPNQEIIIIKKEGSVYLAVTTQVQDIVAYELRDTKRPAKSMKVGLMPPKLAQICINLIPYFPEGQKVIYDPFCGMGTILQEGWLMGYEMIGSDNSKDMVAASYGNIDWLEKNFQLEAKIRPVVFWHDIARQEPRQITNGIGAVVSEPYLGEALSKTLSKEEALEQLRALSDLYVNFFRNVRCLLKNKGGWVIFMLPAFWVKKDGFVLFPDEFIDEISDIGYTHQHLVPKEIAGLGGLSRRGTFIYARPDARVGREITTWQVVK